MKCEYGNLCNEASQNACMLELFLNVRYLSAVLFLKMYYPSAVNKCNPLAIRKLSYCGQCSSGMASAKFCAGHQSGCVAITLMCGLFWSLPHFNEHHVLNTDLFFLIDFIFFTKNTTKNIDYESWSLENTTSAIFCEAVRNIIAHLIDG